MTDLISRQAVDKIIDELLENDNLQASPSVWHGLHMIKRLPSAQSTNEERKTGKWIYDYDKDEAPFFMQGWKCSACGSRQTYGESRYCMNCGAKMEHSGAYIARRKKDVDR